MFMHWPLPLLSNRWGSSVRLRLKGCDRSLHQRVFLFHDYHCSTKASRCRCCCCCCCSCCGNWWELIRKWSTTSSDWCCAKYFDEKLWHRFGRDDVDINYDFFSRAAFFCDHAKKNPDSARIWKKVFAENWIWWNFFDFLFQTSQLLLTDATLATLAKVATIATFICTDNFFDRMRAIKRRVGFETKVFSLLKKSFNIYRMTAATTFLTTRNLTKKTRSCRSSGNQATRKPWVSKPYSTFEANPWPTGKHASIRISTNGLLPTLDFHLRLVLMV